MVFHADAKSKVHRLVDDSVVLPDFKYDTVQLINRINGIQNAALPLGNSIQSAVGDLGVQRQNLVIHLGQAGLPFTDNLRLERACPIARHLNADITMILPFRRLEYESLRPLPVPRPAGSCLA